MGVISLFSRRQGSGQLVIASGNVVLLRTDVPWLGGAHSHGYRVLVGRIGPVRQSVARFDPRVPDDDWPPWTTCWPLFLIAVFFSSVNAWYWFLGIAVCAVIWYFLVRHAKKVPWLAVGIVGVLAWVMMFEAGVHPTLAGVLVGLLTPAREMHGDLVRRRVPERYANKLQPFSALLALPIFALFATGVHFESLSLGYCSSRRWSLH